MRHRIIRVGLEHEIFEYRTPRRALIGRQMAQREKSVQQAIIRRTETDVCVVPPVVDEYVEAFQRCYVMPPEIRYIHGVPGLKVGHLGGSERLLEARIAD